MLLGYTFTRNLTEPFTPLTNFLMSVKSLPTLILYIMRFIVPSRHPLSACPALVARGIVRRHCSEQLLRAILAVHEPFNVIRQGYIITRLVTLLVLVIHAV